METTFEFRDSSINNVIDSTKQEKLNQILIEKFHQRIEKKRENSKMFIDTIEADGRLLNDFISPLGENSQINFTSNGSVKLNYLQNRKEYNLHANAINQIGEKLGINPAFVRDLTSSNDAWKKDLIAYNLNQFSVHSPRQRVLVREINGQIRGVLSDQYRRLNTNLIFESFIQSANDNEAIIIDAFTDGIKSYIEVVNPQPVTIPFKEGKSTLVAFGLRIANSDFGGAALSVRAFMLQAICINGLVTENLIREIHLGHKLPDNLEVSNRTYRLDTETQASLIKDIVRSQLSSKSIMKKGELIQEAEFTEVDLEKELKQLNRANQLTKGDVESIQKIFVNNHPEDGVNYSSSLWKLSQGISAHGRNSGGLKEKELAEISGKLLERIKS